MTRKRLLGIAAVGVAAAVRVLQVVERILRRETTTAPRRSVGEEPHDATDMWEYTDRDDPC